MLETKPTRGYGQNAIGGMDQQDFREIDLIQGLYPYQLGLQKRIPGKTLERVLDGPIGSIYVFYLVYGRAYRFIDFGSIIIEPIKPPKIKIPPLPPGAASWFDDFSSYTPVGLIQKFWAEGPWAIGIGVCEARKIGYIDPFRVDSTVTPNIVTTEEQPQPGPPPVQIPATTPVTFPVGATTQVLGGSAAAGPNIVGGFPAPFLPAYTTYMDTQARITIPHPYVEIDPTGKAFKANERTFSRVVWGGALDPTMTDNQTSDGYYSINPINTNDFVANSGDTIVLVGTLVVATGGTVLFPTFTSTPVELILGIYPDIPETIQVYVPSGGTVRYTGTGEEGFSNATLTYTDYDVYPPE